MADHRSLAMSPDPSSPDHGQSLGDDASNEKDHAVNTKLGTSSPDESVVALEDSEGNLIYENAEEEPELHARTYIALAAMWLSNMVQVMALSGPPAVLSFIGADLNNTARQTWVPNSLALLQAVLGPVLSSASDTFQARKTILVVTSTIAFIGCAIAPGSKDIYRLIAAQVLIGVGFAAVPLTYCVPSEIAPRRWRPLIQASQNVGASIGAVIAPLVIGAFTRGDRANGWRNFYWVQMAIWGLTAFGIFFGYRPPKRHTRLDHMSLWQKIGQLDLIGFFLLTSGLALLLVGLNSGGGIYPWTDGKVLGPLITGIATLIAFFLFEWKGTKTGIMHHDLFKGGRNRGVTFSICVALIFLEGALLFSYVVFYPELTHDLFETDPFLQVARGTPYWIACCFATVCYGYASARLKSIRSPMLVGYVLWTAGLIGLSTIEPDDSTSAIVFVGLAGLGFAAPLILVVTGVQLSTPHHLIATATALTTSARAVAAGVFTAIYAAAVTSRADRLVPKYVSSVATGAGLPSSSVPAFIKALSANNSTQLAAVSGASSAVIAAGGAAWKQAMADSIRVVYIIAASLGALGVLLCLLLGDLSKTMNYTVDAPIEGLAAKRSRRNEERP